MAKALAFGRDDMSQIKKGAVQLLDDLKGCGAVKTFTEQTSLALDNTSNGSLVELSNKSIPRVTEAYEKVVAMVTDAINQISNLAYEQAVVFKDPASAKVAKDLHTYVSEAKDEADKHIKQYGDVKIKQATEAQDPPVDYKKVMSMVEGYKGISKDLNQIYADLGTFKKSVMGTQIFGGNADMGDVLKSLQKGYADIANDEVIPVIETVSKNNLECIEEYESQMSKAEQRAMDRLKESANKFKLQLSDTKQQTAKTKATFDSAKPLF